MKSIGVYEAGTHWSEMFDRVARGEEIAIARHGTPIAKLVPHNRQSNVSVEDAIAELREFRRKYKHRLRGLTIRQMIEEGRRF
jgi:prevent-host-death family protein